MSAASVPPSDVAFSDSVKAMQTRLGSRRTYARLAGGIVGPVQLQPILVNLRLELQHDPSVVST